MNVLLKTVLRGNAVAEQDPTDGLKNTGEDPGLTSKTVGAYTYFSERDPARLAGRFAQVGARSTGADSEQIFFPLRKCRVRYPHFNQRTASGNGGASLKENPKENFG